MTSDFNCLRKPLRIVKFTNQDKPYTAFVALTDQEFGNVIEAGTGDLTAYSKQILHLVDKFP